MTLRAHLVVVRPAFTLDLAMEVAPGEVVALLGPNGAGKTTALRALAGLTPLTDGHITLDGTTVHGLATEQRPIGMVFQDYLLFPHLSALDNVAFGPRCQGSSKTEARRAAATLLERVGLAGQAAAKPRHLSGGQAQRVALARALAVRPRLLLLDEPLAALDAHTRLEVRSQLRRHLTAFDGATVLVTHDPLDAMVLADRLIVIENGAIVQQGPPAAVARRPRTDYVAHLVGLNLYRGQADDRRVKVGELLLSTSEPLRGPAFVAFPPAALALYRTRPDGSPRNLWQARIEGIERHGDNVRVHLDGPITAFADITPAALAELDLMPGQEVWASVKATETHAYPA
ncbi:ABC transporter ATP-binding protein [Nonomuraea diastatica]|uniref:ABC-type quaternary amine transporter n=1 Tax=Nonomuraea diastatica TaxID=1848329 RepID=A0A4R4X4S1_9ACTN|nr:ABC transporter ATP-binding protein [Nonomuraea diastatica]TDD25313.1 ABC transporter ATP-binding protein [Nonomuraea diastatica]